MSSSLLLGWVGGLAGQACTAQASLVACKCTLLALVLPCTLCPANWHAPWNPALQACNDKQGWGAAAADHARGGKPGERQGQGASQEGSRSQAVCCEAKQHLHPCTTASLRTCMGCYCTSLAALHQCPPTCLLPRPAGAPSLLGRAGATSGHGGVTPLPRRRGGTKRRLPQGQPCQHISSAFTAHCPIRPVGLAVTKALMTK